MKNTQKQSKSSFGVIFGFIIILGLAAGCNPGQVNQEKQSKPAKKEAEKKKAIVEQKEPQKDLGIYGKDAFVETVSSKSGLRHPGTLQNAALLKALKKSLDAKDPERLKLWDDMIKCDRGRIGNRKRWAPPVHMKYKDLLCAKWGGPGIFRYTLDWIMTGNKQSEKNAIEMLNAWSKVESFTPRANDKLGHHRLVGGINLGSVAQAAELLMSSGTSWPKEEQEKFKETWRKVIVPIIAEKRPYFFNGNWDLGITWSLLASAVMLDDKKMFDAEIERLRNGRTNAQFSIYLLPSGQCQETGRDVMHSEMGLYFASLCAQIAWNQGIDLFEGDDYSLGRCYEYLAMYQMGEDRVPYEIYNEAVGRSSRHQSPTPSITCRGKYQNIYEMIYNHYKDYRGVEMPNVKKVLETKTRPERPAPNTQVFSTLCFWNLDLKDDAAKRKAKPADVTVELISEEELQQRNKLKKKK